MLVGAMNNPGEDVLKEVEFILENFDYVEIAIEAPQASPEILRKKRQKLLDLLESCSEKPVAHLPWYFQIAHPYSRVSQAFLEEVVVALEIAGELGADFVGLHLNPLPRFFRDKQKELYMEALERITDVAESLGLKIGVENLALRQISQDVLQDIVESLPVDLLLDIAHAHIGSTSEEVGDFIERFSFKIAHVHAHDNNLRDDLHLPIGAGEIEWEKLLPVLKKFYSGRITLEVHSKDRDYLLLSREKFINYWNNL